MPSPNRIAACKRSVRASTRRFNVELIGEGPIAAVVSQVGLDQFAPEKLQGKTPEDIRWLGQIAARHNEIICQAAEQFGRAAAAIGDGFQHARFAAGDALRVTGRP